MINAYFACVNANGGVNGHPLKLYVIYDQTQPSQITAAAHKLIQQDHVVGIVGVFDLLECTTRPELLAVARDLRDGRRDRPGVLVDPAQRRGQHGTAVQLRRRGPVRAHATPLEDRVRPVQRAGHRLHRGRPGRAGQGGGRPDHRADRERPDSGRDLGRAQPGRRRRPERLGGAELHPARGAGHPPGGPEARPRGPGQGMGLLDARATRTSWPRRWGRSGTTSCSSTPS